MKISEEDSLVKLFDLFYDELQVNSFQNMLFLTTSKQKEVTALTTGSLDPKIRIQNQPGKKKVVVYMSVYLCLHLKRAKFPYQAF